MGQDQAEHRPWLASFLPCPRLHPINTATQVPPAGPRGQLSTSPDTPARPHEQGMRLSWSAHFGVINEMSCQMAGGGGSQSERMNCSLWKPRVPPIPPRGLRSWRGVRGHIPNLRTHTVWSSGSRSPEPDSRLPIFSFAAKCMLFVLYIYIHPQRACPGPACRKPSCGGAGSSPRASFLGPPFLCAHADCWKQCGLVGVLMGGSCLGHTTLLCTVGLVLRGLGQSSFTHSPNIDPSRTPPPGARQREEKAHKSQPCP